MKKAGRVLRQVMVVGCHLLFLAVVAAWIISVLRPLIFDGYWNQTTIRPVPSNASLMRTEERRIWWTLCSSGSWLAFDRGDYLLYYGPGADAPAPTNYSQWKPPRWVQDPLDAQELSDCQHDPGGGMLGFHSFEPPWIIHLTHPPNEVYFYHRILVVPYWALAVFLALPLLAIYGRWWQRKRKLPPGLCRKCGYDLRASNDRCPECGTTIPAEARGPSQGTCA